MSSVLGVRVSGPLAAFRVGVWCRVGAAWVSAGVGRGALAADGGRERVAGRPRFGAVRSDRGPGSGVVVGAACGRALAPAVDAGDGSVAGVSAWLGGRAGGGGDGVVDSGRELIERYSAYLLERRGLAASTVRNYVGVARVFLCWRETVAGTVSLAALDSPAVIAFVLGETGRCSVGSAKCLVTRLRVFLRFLHVEGETCRDLTGAVPSVASWRLAGLVKALDAGRSGGCWPVAIGARESGGGILRC